MSKLNFVNTVWSVILPSVLFPFGVFLVRVFIQESVPDEILQAARIDRAGEFLIFWRIVIPMLRPALVTVFLFSLVASWNNFFLPLVMLSESKLYPLTVGLQAWFEQAAQEGGNSFLFNLVIAGSLVAIVPLIISLLLTVVVVDLTTLIVACNDGSALSPNNGLNWAQFKMTLSLTIL